MDPSATNASALPYGKYASWAGPAAVITGILAVIGSLAGGRGNVAGTVVCIILNPITWLAIWFWFKSKKVTCPHCGTGMPVSIYIESQKIGSIIRCSQCRNEFRKPSMSGPGVNEAPQVVPLKSDVVERVGWNTPGFEFHHPSVLVTEPAPKVAPVRPTEQTELPETPILLAEVDPVGIVPGPNDIITVLASEPTLDPIIMRIDGTSSFLTLGEHQRRGWKEAARCDLSNRNFAGVSFAGANLEGANLDGSDFSGCNFHGAVLRNASAKRCNFEAVKFVGAKLCRIDFDTSNLRWARFCSYESGEFFSALIDNVNFHGCNLSGSVFASQSPNGGGGFGSCRVHACNFSDSDMSHSELWRIDFRTCSFTNTNLFAAMLRGSNFEGIDISNTNLINANLSRITYSDRSKFPAGYLLPADTTNADVYRRADARLAEICAYLVIAVVILVIALVFTKILSATRLTRLSPNGSPALENSLSHGDLPPSTLVDHTPSMDRTRLISSENSRSGSPVWKRGQTPFQQSSHGPYTGRNPEPPQTDDPHNKVRQELLSKPTNVSISKLREANSLYGRQQYAKAIALYEQLIANDKLDSTPKNNLARLLATCPDQRFRDGRRALELALEAYEQTSRSDWKLICIIWAAFDTQSRKTSPLPAGDLRRACKVHHGTSCCC